MMTAHLDASMTVIHAFSPAVSSAEAGAIIQSTWEHQRSLREHCNTRIPVARLPPEVLSHIFRYCSPCPAWQSSDFTPSFLAFSQVSHHWRCVALDDSLIWTTPAWCLPQLGMVMLERARKACIQIAVNCASKPGCYELARAALGKFQQIERLQIDGTVQQITELVELITGPMPNLRYLTVWTQDPTRLRIIGLENFPATSLRHVNLYLCVLPWNCLHNLTSLTFRLDMSDGLEMEFSDLFTLLTQNPALEYVSLTGPAVDLTRGVPSFPPSKKTTLRKLQFIQVESSTNDLHIIFWHFAFPSLRHLHLIGSTTAIAVASALTLLGCVAKWLKSESCFECLRAMTCRTDRSGGFIFEANCVDGSVDLGEDSTISLSIQLEQDSLFEVAEYITQIFRLNDIVTMSLDTSRQDERVALYLLQKAVVLPNLCRLDIRDDSFRLLLACMEGLDWTTEKRSSIGPFWRSLRLFSPDMSIIDQNLKMTPLRRFVAVLKCMHDAGMLIPHVLLVDPRCRTNPKETFEKFGLHVDLMEVTSSSGEWLCYAEDPEVDLDCIEDLADP